MSDTIVKAHVIKMLRRIKEPHKMHTLIFAVTPFSPLIAVFEKQEVGLARYLYSLPVVLPNTNTP